MGTNAHTENDQLKRDPAQIRPQNHRHIPPYFCHYYYQIVQTQCWGLHAILALIMSRKARPTCLP